MEKKTVVLALGHRALGNTLPEQQRATKEAAKAAPARSTTLYIALLAIGAIALVILLVLMRLRK